MKVNPNEIELLISAVKPEQYPETGLSEVGLSGRSNVGKSTFINSMIGRKKYGTYVTTTWENTNT